MENLPDQQDRQPDLAEDKLADLRILKVPDLQEQNQGQQQDLSLNQGLSPDRQENLILHLHRITHHQDLLVVVMAAEALVVQPDHQEAAVDN